MPDTNASRLLIRAKREMILPEGIPVQVHHPLAEIDLAAGVTLKDLAAAVTAGNVQVLELRS